MNNGVIVYKYYNKCVVESRKVYSSGTVGKRDRKNKKQEQKIRLPVGSTLYYCKSNNFLRQKDVVDNSE